jgi:predicted esterase
MRTSKEILENVSEKVKLNVLCLHGYRQNAEQFKSKVGSFRKFLKSSANFVFIDSPHLAKPLHAGGQEVEEQRSWWFNRADGGFDIEQGPAVYGFDESLKFLEETWQKGNFDGILAFSQGASFLSAVCAMSQRNREFETLRQILFIL